MGHWCLLMTNLFYSESFDEYVKFEIRAGFKRDTILSEVYSSDFGYCKWISHHFGFHLNISCIHFGVLKWLTYLQIFMSLLYFIILVFHGWCMVLH
jgi:hypothetical protein